MRIKNKIYILFSIILSMNIFAKTEMIPICYKDSYGFIDNNFEVKIPVCNKIIHFGDYDYVIVEKTKNEHVVYDSNCNEIYNSKGTSFFYKIKPITNDKFYVLFISDGFWYDIKTKSKLDKSFSPSLSYEDENNNLLAGDFNYYKLDSGIKVFVDKMWDSTYPFVNKRAVTRNFENKWEIINENGVVVRFVKGQIAEKYSQGLIPYIDTVTSYESGFLDIEGNVVFSCPIYLDDDKWSAPRIRPQISCSFKEDVACVPVSADEWRIYDKTGKVLFKTNEYKLADNTFSEGKICVYKETSDGKQYLFLDKKGKPFSKYRFDKANSFYNGYAMVVYNGKDALLDSSGKLIFVSDILGL